LSIPISTGVRHIGLVPQKHQITAIENDPCLEATLLHVAGERVHRSTRDNKTAFVERYGAPATATA
jgi:hypothetical protein